MQKKMTAHKAIDCLSINLCNTFARTPESFGKSLFCLDGVSNKFSDISFHFDFWVVDDLESRMNQNFLNFVRPSR